MSDIVERLRKVESSTQNMSNSVTTNQPGLYFWYRNPDGPEAADEIERLREQQRYVHDQLQFITDPDDNAPIERMVRSVVARLAEAERLLRETRQDVEFHASEAECWDCVTEQGECIRRLARIDAFLAKLEDKP